MDSQHLRCLGSKSQTFWHWRALFRMIFWFLDIPCPFEQVEKGSECSNKVWTSEGSPSETQQSTQIAQRWGFSAAADAIFRVRNQAVSKTWESRQTMNGYEVWESMRIDTTSHMPQQHPPTRCSHNLYFAASELSCLSILRMILAQDQIIEHAPNSTAQIISSLYNLWTFISWFSFGFLDFACLLFRFNLGCFGFCFWFFDHESVKSSKSLHCLNTRSFAPKSQRHGVFLECGRMLFRCRMQTFIFVAVVFRISIWFVISEPSFSNDVTGHAACTSLADLQSWSCHVEGLKST